METKTKLINDLLNGLISTKQIYLIVEDVDSVYYFKQFAKSEFSIENVNILLLIFKGFVCRKILLI
jgi:hypothetical protein